MTKKRNGNQFLKESELQYLELVCKPFNVIYIQKREVENKKNIGYIEIIIESEIKDDAEFIDLPKFKLHGKNSRFKGMESYVLYTPKALLGKNYNAG